MRKEDFLYEAAQIVVDRNETHGAVLGDFTRISSLWNQLFAGKLNQPFEPDEVAMAMICVKLSRLTSNPDHKDSWSDIAGYAACGWECRDAGSTSEPNT